MGVSPTKHQPPKVDYSPQEKSIISTPGITKEIQTGSIDPQKLHNLLPNSSMLRGQPKFDEAVDESFDFTGLTKDLRSVRGPSLEEAFANSQKKNQKLAMEVQRDEQTRHDSNGDLLDTKMLQDSDPLSTKLDQARRDSLLLTDLKHGLTVDESSEDQLQEASENSQDLKKSLTLEKEQSHQSLDLEDQSEVLDDHSVEHHVEDQHDTDKGLNVSKEMENELMALDNLVERPTMSEDELVELEKDPHSVSQSQHHAIELDEHISSKNLSHKTLEDSSPRLETQSSRVTDLEDLSEEILDSKNHSQISEDEHHHSTQGSQTEDLKREIPLATDIESGNGDLIKKTLIESGHPNLKSIFKEHPEISVNDELKNMKSDPDIQGMGITDEMTPQEQLDVIEQQLESGELRHKPELRKKVESLMKAQSELVKSTPAWKSPNTGVVKFRKFKKKKLTTSYETMTDGRLPKGSINYSAKSNNGNTLGVMPDGTRKFRKGHYNKFHGAEKRFDRSQFDPVGSKNPNMIKKARLIRLDKLARGRKSKAMRRFLKV